MPLFKVSVTLETVVFVEDPREARYVARDGLETALDTDIDAADIEPITDVRDLPDGWDAESLVWHHADTYGDLSVKDALARSQREADRDRERNANAAFAAGENE